MGSCQSIASSEVRPEQKQKSKPQIIIKSLTWSRDSHGLFDYESKTLTKKNIKSSSDGILVRDANNIVNVKENDGHQYTKSNEVIKLNIRDGNYWVTSSIPERHLKERVEDDWEDNNHSLWLVVKSFKSSTTSKPGFKLTEGDLIKLGRIKFRVKELRSSGSVNKKILPVENEKNLKTEEDAKSLEDEERPRKNSKASVAGSCTSVNQACRICLGELGDADDPFFSPCQCSGTMKYIHVLCLQRWLKSKIHVKQTGFSTSVYWKTLECELCKTTYPSSFVINGKNYDIVEVERPECGYLMLEILSKEKNVLRGIHIIKMEGKNNIRLGRGHDSDIRITDISVSRCHALIRLDKGSFYLEDNSSKFGTLVFLKKPFPLFGDFNNISIQVGRTVLSLSVKKNLKTLPSGFGPNQIHDPTEIEDDNTFGKSYHESEAHLNRHQTSDVPGNQINQNNNHENDLPSPINQDHEEDDYLSQLSADQPEAEFPEDEGQEGDQQGNQQGNQPNAGAPQAQAQIQIQANQEMVVENLTN